MEICTSPHFHIPTPSKEVTTILHFVFISVLLEEITQELFDDLEGSGMERIKGEIQKRGNP